MGAFRDDAPFAELLGAARNGDGAAWESLYRSLAPAVAGYLRLQGVRDVDDVTSDVFLGVVRNVSSFDGDEAAFRSWVFVIAHRRVQDSWRRNARRPAPDELTGDTVPGGDAECDALNRLGTARVHQLCNCLACDQRDVLLLRIVADLTVEQVAATLGKTPGAVKQLQRRGLQAIRKQLISEGVPL